MTIPQEPQPPSTIGTQPRNADEVNALVGTHLRAFVTSKLTVGQDHDFFAVTDLKAAPYFFTDEQEALMKSALADLDTALDAIDMTFISRIIGMA
jgi:hypothetical protein